MESKPLTPPCQFAFNAVAVPQGNGTFLLKPGKPVLELTPLDAGKALGVSRSLIYEWLNEGILPHRRPSLRKIWIPAAAVEELRQKTMDPEFWASQTKKTAAPET